MMASHLINAGKLGELRQKLEQATKRSIHVLEFERFREGMRRAKDKMPEKYWSHVLLLTLWPHSIQAVLDGSTDVSQRGDGGNLILAVRAYAGCNDALCCLYDTKVNQDRTDIDNDAVLDHVRIWNCEACPWCHPERYYEQ